MSAAGTDPEVEWRRLRPTTWSMCVLIFLVAFEAFAVTTVMPTVSRVLDGTSLYAFAFAGPLATGVIGMVVAGTWCDRHGPRAPLSAAVVLFAAGLLVAGLAPTMWVLVLGRLVQGVGGGAMTVALYVIVARLYPALLHPRVFGGFSAAWVLPSLVGPAAAGAVAQHIGWRWVFVGVAILVLPVSLVLLPAVRRIGAPGTPAAPPKRGRLAWATLAAAAVLGLNLAVYVHLPWSLVVAGLAAATAIVALRPLVPAGTLRAARGLPAVIATRALVAGGFSGAEVYLPYLLTDRYGFSPTTAGIALTFAALAWAATSWLQGRLGERLTSHDAIVLGAALVVVAVAGVTTVAVGHLAPAAAIASWTLAGAGMGLIYSRLTVLVLAYSAPGSQGTHSSALSIADSIGAALALALTGLAFTTVLGSGASPDLPFTASLLVALVFAAGALGTAPRVRARQVDETADAAPSSALRS
ncbi:MFS transporter [Cellulomonas sp. McL0617]|uniref:MFS transporter n=1 Tax=Cellulomonas sp. McL0617 TaxID=3415675 RepID=UPI003CF75122